MSTESPVAVIFAAVVLLQNITVEILLKLQEGQSSADLVKVGLVQGQLHSTGVPDDPV